MPKEIFEVVRERFHLSDRTQYIVQGHWPKDAVMEAYLDQHKLKLDIKIIFLTFFKGFINKNAY